MALMARSKAKHKGPAKHKAKLKPKNSATAKRKAKGQKGRGVAAMDAELTAAHAAGEVWCSASWYMSGRDSNSGLGQRPRSGKAHAMCHKAPTPGVCTSSSSLFGRTVLCVPRDGAPWTAATSSGVTAAAAAGSATGCCDATASAWFCTCFIWLHIACMRSFSPPLHPAAAMTMTVAAH